MTIICDIDDIEIQICPKWKAWLARIFGKRQPSQPWVSIYLWRGIYYIVSVDISKYVPTEGENNE